MNIDSSPNKRGLRAKPYDWRGGEGAPVPGIGLMAGGQLVRHLTPTQALNLANQLTDAVKAHTKERNT